MNAVDNWLKNGIRELKYNRLDMIMTRSAYKFWNGSDLPKEIAYLTKNGFSGFGVEEEFKYVTFKEINDRKKQSQEQSLHSKRLHDKKVPGYIWVFYNPGSFFGGWWLYIKTLKKDYAINFRERQKINTTDIMCLLPMGVIPTSDNFDYWAEKFTHTYRHVGFKRKRRQGILKCHCFIDEGGNILKVELHGRS